MITSMTGFAAGKGAGCGYSWTWDIRSVNGKGLELRLKVPDWIDGLELSLRQELQKALGRGNVSLSLRLSREDQGPVAPRLNLEMVQTHLQSLLKIEAQAAAQGLSLAPSRAIDVLALRGVVEHNSIEEDTTALRTAILADLPSLILSFKQMRESEGAALDGVIARQLGQIRDLVAGASRAAEERRPKVAEQMAQALARLQANSEGFDPARIAQELALLAVRQDVTEELDRLQSHIAAADALLRDTAPVGRKFDFLMQEFLREANTLLSKSQDAALTRIGLDLKTLIDQMREQVQNVE